MQRNKTQDMVLIALLAGLIAAVSPHSLYIGPIPFSLGVFGVAFAAGMLPPLSAAACLGVYLALGFIGLPVFTGYRGGPQVLFGLTGGYLVGYFALALAIAFAVKYGKSLWLQILCGYVGMAVCYLVGTGWYVVVSGYSFAAGLAACVLPFILPDAIKIALALVLAKEINRRLHTRQRGTV